MESFLLFTIFFILFSVCFVYPPPEFVSIGLTVESLFSFYLKNESDSFVGYHIKRSVVTIVTHCSMPLVYVLVVSYMFPEWTVFDAGIAWKLFVALSLVPPTICAVVVYRWSKMNWLHHPIGRKLKCFTAHGATLNDITRNVDNEYRSINKVIIRSNAVTRVVATENWLIKVSPYDLCLAHQSDVTLVVTSSNQYRYLPDASDGGQYLNIDVQSSRPNTDSFKIRINSLDFKDLQERVSRPIDLMENIVVHKSLTDRFLEAFRNHVRENPKIESDEVMEVCIGCMMTASNIKLFTSCGDLSGARKCTMCFCKPMWCVDCMGKWFASRQDQDTPETWLSSKCTCPMCRNTFCILDVCLVVSTGEETGNNANS